MKNKRGIAFAKYIGIAYAAIRIASLRISDSIKTNPYEKYFVGK